jgi:hypothetical protein
MAAGRFHAKARPQGYFTSNTCPWAMADQSNNLERCDFCKGGHVTRHDQPIAFRQRTDRGYVRCRVTVPLGICARCGSGHWNEAAEAIVEAAVRREYERLRSAGAILDGTEPRDFKSTHRFPLKHTPGASPSRP